MSTEAMKQALVAFEDILSAESRGFGMEYIKGYCGKMISDLHPAIEQAEKREWVGLTDEEVESWNIFGRTEDGKRLHKLVRSIEAKLKEKNT
jgi:hypothetical protein